MFQLICVLISVAIVCKEVLYQPLLHTFANNCDGLTIVHFIQKFKSNMTLRFLMLSFDYIRPKDPNLSLASASIITYLKQKFPYFKTKIDVIHRRFDVSEGRVEDVTQNVLTNIEEIKPQIIGTGVYVWNEVFVSHVFQQMSRLEILERKPIVILGGPQITYSFKGSLERLYPYAHAFIRGYAEESLSKLLKAISESQKPIINGVHYYGDRDIGSKSDLVLERLPSPLLSHQIKHSGYIRLETKRGCPFSCSFCQHRDSDNKRDATHVNRIEKEVEWIVGQNIDDISIVDPIFNIKTSNYLDVLNYFLKYEYKGRLNLQSRLEMIDQSYIERCNKLMDNNVKLELEFGVQTVIKEEMQIIDRPQSLRRLQRIGETVNNNRIPFEVSLIYGLPMQTIDSFKKSIQFVSEKIRPNRIRAWPLMLLKGTQLYEKKTEYNIREKVLNAELQPMDDLRQYNGIPHVISSSSFTENDWIVMKEIAQKLNSKQEF